jgi:hypothetical protein
MQTARIPGKALLALLLAALLPGCTTYHLTVNESNYLTFEYPVDDVATEDARKKAVAVCEGRKQVAVRSENICTLNLCTTTYQCMDKEDADAFQKK